MKFRRVESKGLDDIERLLSRSTGCGWRRMFTVRALALIALITSQACVPQIESTTVDRHYPTPGPAPVATAHEQERPPEVSAEVGSGASGDFVTVSVRRSFVCSRTTMTPMTREVGTVRTLQSGTLAQVANITAAALMIAGGIAAYQAAPCKDNECSPSANKQRSLGIGIAVGGALPAGAFVWNIVRASDDIEVSPSNLKEDTIPVACPSRPAEAHISVGFGNVRVDAVTSADGRASIPIPWARIGDPPASSAVVTVDMGRVGNATTSVSLSGLGPYVAWATRQRAAEAAEAAARRQQEAADRAQREAERAAEQQVVAKVHAWANAKIHTTYDTKSYKRETCWNRVDNEVPCDGAAAFRKDVSAWTENRLTIVNRSDGPITCAVRQVVTGLLGRLFDPSTTPTTVDIEQGRSRAFVTQGGVVQNLLQGDATMAYCVTQVALFAKATGVPVRSLHALDEPQSNNVGVFLVFRSSNPGAAEVYPVIGSATYRREGDLYERVTK